MSGLGLRTSGHGLSLKRNEGEEGSGKIELEDSSRASPSFISRVKTSKKTNDFSVLFYNLLKTRIVNNLKR